MCVHQAVAALAAAPQHQRKVPAPGSAHRAGGTPSRRKISGAAQADAVSDELYALELALLRTYTLASCGARAVSLQVGGRVCGHATRQCDMVHDLQMLCVTSCMPRL